MDEVVITRKDKTVAPKGKSEEKQAERCFVTASTTIAEVLDWDSSGKQVFFAEDSPTFDEAVVKEFSKLTAIKYEQLIALKERLANEDPEWGDINKRVKISQNGYASPQDIAFGNKAKPGLTSKLVREDRVGYWEAKGYRMATPKMMADAKMRLVEGHYEHGTLNAPKEYLMVTTEENRALLMKKRDEHRQAVDVAQVEDLKKKATDAGLNAFDA